MQNEIDPDMLQATQLFEKLKESLETKNNTIAELTNQLAEAKAKLAKLRIVAGQMQIKLKAVDELRARVRCEECSKWVYVQTHCSDDCLQKSLSSSTPKKRKISEE